MGWLEELTFKWRWLGDRISQWRLWYSRAFKMRRMPVRPRDGIDQMIAEQELRKKQEERWQEESKERERRPHAQAELEQEARKQNIEKDVIPKDWLRGQLSLEQAEADNTPAGGGLPFNKLNSRWERLKSSFQEGDQIWTFSSSSESAEHFAGRSGVAVVRDGRVVDCIVTRMN